MSILNALGMIAKGFQSGAEYDRDLEERKRRQADEARRQQEFDRENRERTALRRSLFGLVEQGEEEDADINATALEGAGDQMREAAGGAESGIAGIGLPFAGMAVSQAGKAVREEGKKRSQFDPDVPYETVAEVQQRIRESRNRNTDRRVSQTRLAKDAQTRRDALALKREQDARKTGDLAVNRAMLRRLAEKKEIDYTPEEIDGLSEDGVNRLVETSGRGNLGTRDFRERQQIRIDLTPPKESGGGNGDGDRIDGLSVTDLSGLSRMAQAEREAMLARAPAALRDAGIDVSGAMSAQDLLTTIRAKPETAALLRNQQVARWLSDLTMVESKGNVASMKSAELLRRGERRVTPGEPPQSNNVRTKPTTAAPAPAKPTTSAKPSAGTPALPFAAAANAAGGAAAPAGDGTPTTLAEWQEVYDNAAAAYRADPKDTEARLAMEEALKVLRTRRK